MVTTRKAAPRAPIAGDQLVAHLLDLLEAHTVEIIQDNGYVVRVTGKYGADNLGVRRYHYVGERLDELLRRAADAAPPDFTEYL